MSSTGSTSWCRCGACRSACSPSSSLEVRRTVVGPFRRSWRNVRKLAGGHQVAVDAMLVQLRLAGRRRRSLPDFLGLAFRAACVRRQGRLPGDDARLGRARRAQLRTSVGRLVQSGPDRPGPRRASRPHRRIRGVEGELTHVTDQRPAWADALTNAFVALEEPAAHAARCRCWPRCRDARSAMRSWRRSCSRQTRTSLH